MPETVKHILEYLVLCISVTTALVLTWGVLFGVIIFVRAELKRLSGRSCASDRILIRKQVGFYLLFGIELLIAADIIETMINPSLEHLAILAGVSAIRIATGYALGKEISHLDQDTVDSS